MVNKVILIGNVGGDPEVRVLETGVKMAKFRLATTEMYHNAAGEKCENTQWHSIVLWRGAADIAEKYVKKGSQIYIEGKLRYREVNDPITHAIRNLIEIVGEEIRLLGRRPIEMDADQPPKPVTQVVDPDGLPF